MLNSRLDKLTAEALTSCEALLNYIKLVEPDDEDWTEEYAQQANAYNTALRNFTKLKECLEDLDIQRANKYYLFRMNEYPVC